jgi:hypothetical protein
MLKSVPDVPRKDYQVSEAMQLTAVCQDFGAVVTNWRMKVSEDYRKSKAQTRDKKP